MKPSDKQIDSVRALLARAVVKRGLSRVRIGKIAKVHPSQVGRICAGEFKTFSHNVVRVCNTLGVRIPKTEPRIGRADPAWDQAQSSMRRIWDETPEGALAIARMLDAIAELHLPRGSGPGTSAEGDETSEPTASVRI